MNGDNNGCGDRSELEISGTTKTPRYRYVCGCGWTSHWCQRSGMATAAIGEHLAARAKAAELRAAAAEVEPLRWCGTNVDPVNETNG